MSENNDMATIVSIDRKEGEAIQLRFVMNSMTHEVRSKEVCLTPDLAEQLLQMLTDELGGSASYQMWSPQRPVYAS